MLDLLKDIDWKTLLLGEEQWSFLLEVVLRSLVMFLVIVLTLRLLGKRGVKQLSVFELGVIIGLGSAAGDPMFYKDVGLVPGILVFGIVMSLYRLITFLINRNDRFEQFMEGTPTCLIQNGCFLVENFKKEPIAIDELFSQLRLKSISHLGQIDQAIIETNGEVSVFYTPDDQVKFGLPILPSLSEHKLEAIPEEGHYACTYCGNTGYLQPTPSHQCNKCGKKEWLKAINDKRIH
jgi:uncharacterized membrane protein YcaP (DUF421 family)